MNELRDEIELPPIEDTFGLGMVPPMEALRQRERQLKSSQAANREQDAELTLLREEAAENARIIGMSGSREAAKDAEIERLKQHLTAVQHIAVKLQEQRDEYESRASVGEKWIKIKEGCEMPPLLDSDEYEYAEVMVYSPRYPEQHLGRYRISSNTWTFSGSNSDFTDCITHWQPIPAPPTLPGEEKA